jgi:quercetin dioxygenase-like cupin family protein
MEDSKSGATPKGLEPAKAIALANLVQRAEGSIVSRVLLKAAQGSVTLFCFDAGQALSEHTAPFDALVQVLEGTVELTIGGKPVTVKAGESALMPANVPHAVKAIEALKMLLTMLKA